jgi:hypothetical protein
MLPHSLYDRKFCHKVAAIENTNVCLGAKYFRFLVNYCCLYQPYTNTSWQQTVPTNKALQDTDPWQKLF